MKIVITIATLLWTLAGPSGETRAETYVGGGAMLNPAGTLSAEALGTSESEGTAVSYGLFGSATISLNKHFALAFQPQLIFNVKDPEDDESATQLNFPIRLLAGSKIAPKIRAYGFGGVGYSMVFVPDFGLGSQEETVHGFLIDLGGGATYDLNDKVALVGELGYQLSFGQTEVSGIDVDLNHRFVNLSFGIRTRL